MGHIRFGITAPTLNEQLEHSGIPSEWVKSFEDASKMANSLHARGFITTAERNRIFQRLSKRINEISDQNTVDMSEGLVINMTRNKIDSS